MISVTIMVYIVVQMSKQLLFYLLSLSFGRRESDRQKTQFSFLKQL